ncbi:hypothetical protein RRG08_034118 [Elysia crispata]|uniref:Acyltransferase n=1 Tax=Elysia crispata TaxID=231223 RepID=A0AAE0ZKY1_9GAST|nr:hypothetical protein RRG08_034118 [Elysia crispata]
MSLFGLELVPLNLPLEKRLQTLGVLHFTYLFLFFGLGTLFLFLYLLFFTSYYLIPLAYYVWYRYDRSISEQGGRRSNWVRRWRIFKWAAEYFPVELVKTCDLNPNKNYILACHPHGIMCQSHFVNFASEATGFSNKFPGIKSYLTALSSSFSYPLFREYFMLSGSIQASGASIDWVLTKEGTGNAVALIVGGAKEALDARPGNHRLKLKDRRGFCKRALLHGASLVPVYAFGENDLYSQAANPEGSKVRKFQNFLTCILGFSPPMFYGRGFFNYTFGLLPYQKPVYTVVGSALDVVKAEDPSQEQIDFLHNKYCQALIDLFETHKLKYGLRESDHLTFY